MKNFYNMASVLLFLFSSHVISGASEGLVTTPLVSASDVFMFSAGTHSARPACSTQALGTWAVDLKTLHGRAIQSLVMSAHAQKKRVHVQGKNACIAWGDRESVEYLYIVD